MKGSRTYDLCPSTSHSVEWRSNRTGWQKLTHHEEDGTVDQYSVVSTRLDNRTHYQFRVTAFFMDDDKPTVGLPGPVSKAARPRCPGAWKFIY